MTPFYFNTKDSCVAHSIDAPVFAVKGFQRGFYPIYTPATAEQLNHDVPTNVLEAALCGSMFGWNVPAARDAVEYIQSVEKQLAISAL